MDDIEIIHGPSATGGTATIYQVTLEQGRLITNANAWGSEETDRSTDAVVAHSGQVLRPLEPLASGASGY